MRKTVLIFILFILGGCTTTQPSINDLFSDRRQGSLEELSFSKDELPESSPFSLIVDNMMIIGTPMANTFLTLFDINSSNKIGDKVYRGRGPLELVGLKSLFVADSNLYAFGGMASGKMLVVNSSQLQDSIPDYKTLPVESTKGGHYFVVMPVNGNRYVATGIFQDTEQFTLLNNDFSVVSLFDEYPEDKATSGLSSQDKGMGFQGLMVRNAAGTKFAWVSNFGSVLKFFDLPGQYPVKLAEYSCQIPIFSSRSTADVSMVVHDVDKNLRGALSLATDGEKIFVLHCDKTMREASDKPESDVIYVFDFDGSPLYAIKTGYPIRGLIAGYGSEELYAHVQDENAEQVIYKINYAR